MNLRRRAQNYSGPGGGPGGWEPMSPSPSLPRLRRMAPSSANLQGRPFLRNRSAHKNISWHEVSVVRGHPRGVLRSFRTWVWAWVSLALLVTPVQTKYVEGFLKTSEVGGAQCLFSPRPLFDSKDTPLPLPSLLLNTRDSLPPSCTEPPLF